MNRYCNCSVKSVSSLVILAGDWNQAHFAIKSHWIVLHFRAAPPNVSQK